MAFLLCFSEVLTGKPDITDDEIERKAKTILGEFFLNENMEVSSSVCCRHRIELLYRVNDDNTSCHSVGNGYSSSTGLMRWNDDGQNVSCL